MNSDAPPLLLKIIPGLQLLRNYRREWFLPDVLAGVSVCIVMIPSVIAYSGLMGLPPQYGLYASLGALVLYAFFGSSRQVIVGPDITLALLTASAIAPLAAGSPTRAASLAAVVATLSGLLLLFAARAKIASVADFLSKPVLVGYMTGAALILMASQLNKLFGISLQHSDFFPRLAELAGKLSEAHLPTLTFGLGLLLLIILLQRIRRKLPSALIVCVVAIGVSLGFHLEQRGVAVVGSFRGGLPAFMIPDVDWRDIHTVLPAVIGISLLTYTQGILLARAFAAKNCYEVDANQELVALGLANVAVGLFQGFSITGSQARTAISDAAGGQTPLVSLVAAATLTLFLIFLTPLIAPLPAVALAAILVYSGFSLVEFNVMKRIYRYYPRSAVVAAITTVGVLAVGVVPGILVGVTLSLLGLINRISHPPDAVLSQVTGGGFHDLGPPDESKTIPGLIVYRFYAPLLFCNAGHFVERVRHLIASSPVPVRWFLLDAQAIPDIDVTAAESLNALNHELKQHGIDLKIAHANRPLRKILSRIGFAREIGQESFYGSVHECVDRFETSTSK